MSFSFFFSILIWESFFPEIHQTNKRPLQFKKSTQIGLFERKKNDEKGKILELLEKSNNNKYMNLESKNKMKKKRK